jgi:hypothetical protein
MNSPEGHHEEVLHAPEGLSNLPKGVLHLEVRYIKPDADVVRMEQVSNGRTQDGEY